MKTKWQFDYQINVALEYFKCHCLLNSILLHFIWVATTVWQLQQVRWHWPIRDTECSSFGLTFNCLIPTLLVRNVKWIPNVGCEVTLCTHLSAAHPLSQHLSTVWRKRHPPSPASDRECFQLHFDHIWKHSLLLPSLWLFLNILYINNAYFSSRSASSVCDCLIPAFPLVNCVTILSTGPCEEWESRHQNLSRNQLCQESILRAAAHAPCEWEWGLLTARVLITWLF